MTGKVDAGKKLHWSAGSDDDSKDQKGVMGSKVLKGLGITAIVVGVVAAAVGAVFLATILWPAAAGYLGAVGLAAVASYLTANATATLIVGTGLVAAGLIFSTILGPVMISIGSHRNNEIARAKKDCEKVEKRSQKKLNEIKGEIDENKKKLEEIRDDIITHLHKQVKKDFILLEKDLSSLVDNITAQKIGVEERDSKDPKVKQLTDDASEQEKKRIAILAVAP